MNFILRNTPKPLIRTVARIEKARVRTIFWFRRNGETIFEWTTGILAVALVLGIGIGTAYFFVHRNNQHTLAVAKQYHYLPKQAAYCDHSNDSTNTTNGGWIPCTIISVNNPQYTSYFVSYGTIQANIGVTHMRQAQ